jgi:hypothetical protein
MTALPILATILTIGLALAMGRHLSARHRQASRPRVHTPTPAKR